MNTKTLWLVVGLLSGCQGAELSQGDDSASIDDELAAGEARPVSAASTHSVLRNAAGYNPRFDQDEAPWSTTRPDFAAALRESGAQIIRYPGGTFANSWDYDHNQLFPARKSDNRDGWVNAARVEPKRVSDWIAADSRPVYNVADLARVAGGATGVNVVFHMNMLTPGQDFYEWKKGRKLDGSVGSDDWFEMLDDRYARFKRMLDRAKENGITVRFIELGNEYYFGHEYTVETFPTGRSHGIAARRIAAKLKRDFGNDVKVAATASCVPGDGARRQTWNSGLYDAITGSEVTHVTMHAYKAINTPERYGEESFQRAIADWVDVTERKFNQSGARTTFLKNEGPWRVWYTETNANWDGTLEEGEGTKADESRWAQSLAEAYSTVHLYDRGNATMLLQFNFTGTVRKRQGDDGSWLFNRGLVMQPFMRAAAGATSATVLDIPGRNIDGTNRSIVQGLCFEGGERTRCSIVNLASNPVKLDLSAMFPAASELRVEGYRNDLNSTEPPVSVSRTASTRAVMVPGYSVLELERP